MGASSSRTRKPLSDCTNTVENLTLTLNQSQSSSTSTKNSSSIIKRTRFISENTATTPAKTRADGAAGSGKGKADGELTESGDVLVSKAFTPRKSSLDQGAASGTIKSRNLISANTSKSSTKTQDQATGSSNTAKVKGDGKLTEPGGKGNEKLTEPGDIFLPPVSTPSRTLKPSFPEGTARHEAFEPSPVYVRRPSAVKIMRKEKEIVVPKSCSPALKTRSKRDKMNEAGVSSLSKSCPPPRKRQRRTTSKEDAAIHNLPQDFIEQQKAYFAEIDAFELSEEEVDVLSEEESS
ncbi:hypothetical protein M5689_002275 [Euphorbia peplus]|nr:hypothetical protein M5689_002275 [Euphorbia peplus]